MASAAVLVGVHGAALSHAAWARPGAAVVEVLPRKRGDGAGTLPIAAFQTLARARGLG